MPPSAPPAAPSVALPQAHPASPAPAFRAGSYPGVRYAFGPFVLDPAEHVLLRDGAPVPARSKALDVLAVLLAHAGRLVTKEELMAAVWPGLVVEENTVSVTVSRLRALLGDASRHGRYVETVPGYGYRFVAAVEVLLGKDPSGDGMTPALPPTPVLAAPAEAVEVPAVRPLPAEPSRRRQGLRVMLAVVVVAGLGGLVLYRVSGWEPSGPANTESTSPAPAVGPVVSPTGASFLGLGDLPGGPFESRAYAVSADGDVVVGDGSSAEGLEAVRWTLAGGMVGLGDLPGGLFRSLADGVSADGSVIVGESYSTRGNEAFLWTPAGGMQMLGGSPGCPPSSRATGISADGSVVVGFADGCAEQEDDHEAFRWAQVTRRMERLGPGYAYAVSADGSVVVGHSSSTSRDEAFRWTRATGMVGLGDLPSTAEDGSMGSAFGVSADGSVVVGRGHSPNGFEALQWTPAGGMVGLGDLPGGIFESAAYQVSADGAVAVGYGSSVTGHEASLWTSAEGMRSLKTTLEAHGVSPSGWQLRVAYDVALSRDRLIIVGEGLNPSGQTEAWRAVLPWGRASARARRPALVR